MKPSFNEANFQLHNSLPTIDLETIDIGNTSCKLGLFQNGTLARVSRSSSLPAPKDSLTERIICSVHRDVSSSFKWLAGSFLNASINYEQTLGHDRLVLGAHLTHISKILSIPIIVIDAGTFITVDSVTADGFQGGLIYPGREVFLKAYDHGRQLPSLDPNQRSLNMNWPNSTSEAILQSADIYLEAIARDLIQKATSTQSLIVITGGGRDTITAHLNSRVKFESFPNLLHYSLYFTHCKLANP